MGVNSDFTIEMKSNINNFIFDGHIDLFVKMEFGNAISEPLSNNCGHLYYWSLYAIVLMPSTKTQQSPMAMASIILFLFLSFIFNFSIYFYYSLDFICISASETRILNVSLSIVMRVYLYGSVALWQKWKNKNVIFHFCSVCGVACRCWRLLAIVTNVLNCSTHSCFQVFLVKLRKLLPWEIFSLAYHFFSFVLLPCCFDQIKLFRNRFGVVSECLLVWMTWKLNE